MKRVVVFLLFLVCTTVFAHEIKWYIDGNLFHTTTCTAGAVVNPPTPTEKQGLHFAGWSKYPYVPIEYLESTGSQSIDTGIVPDGDDYRFVFRFTLTETPDRWGAVFGNYIDEEHASWRFIISSADKAYVNSNTETRSGKVAYNVSLDTPYTVDIEYLKATINDEVFEFSAPTAPANTRPVYLYGMRSSSESSSSLVHARIYYFKIYKNGSLLRDFIPVLDTNGKPCMYDLVTNQYYYNSETSEFIAGPKTND